MSCDHCVCMCEGVSVCVCAWQISVSVCMPQGAFIECPWHGLSIMLKRLVESNGHPCLPNWPQIRYMNQYGSYYLQPSPACRERFCLGITLQSGLYFSVCLCQVMHFWWFRSLYLGKVLVYKIIHSCYDIPTSHTTWWCGVRGGNTTVMCIVLKHMQTLDGVGCPDYSFTLHAVHSVGISWPPLLPVGKMLHYVSKNINLRRCCMDAWSYEGRA